ncbi:hypothetical protein ROG8370_01847 [Roseovarius gaetbuli]|uniref:DoxX n=1 Tax=Roseovarius gaetbuli TaxID=1356575 RepID=A0A1X6ZAD9_9RHOB|nr:hypothetical protein [Roseovarius gaetbuli]SLN43597.1 hypothetical protein ROG8370_01847 [Roseovarius gaetbuli]
MSLKPGFSIDQAGLNLIRIVIGSYFMALSIGLVAGLDPAAIFTPLMPTLLADILGGTVMFMLSACFMAGIQLRLVALSLAIFVFSNSLTQNMLHVVPGSVSAFWRDLTLTCAVLLTYSSLSRTALRRASVLAHRARLRHARETASNPRRITLPARGKRPIQQEIRRALIAANLMRRPRKPEDEPDILNIFANL